MKTDQEIIEGLEARIEVLKEENKSLRSRIEYLESIDHV